MFVFYSRVLVLFIILVAPIFISKAAVPFLDTVTNNGTKVFTILYLFLFLILWLLFFFRWTDYYLDVWVLTNKRIFDVEQKGFFSRSMSVFRLERIEDITININGILATFLKYGDIHIHTAGTHDDDGDGVTDLTIRTAKDPLQVKQEIMDQHSAVLQGLNIDGVERPRINIAKNAAEEKRLKD